jgi:hypothetical protein
MMESDKAKTAMSIRIQECRHWMHDDIDEEAVPKFTMDREL